MYHIKIVMTSGTWYFYLVFIVLIKRLLIRSVFNHLYKNKGYMNNCM